MKLLLLRHAQSDGNATGNYSTASADSLSPQGERQASALAVALRSWSFDKIVVSPLERTRATILPYLMATARQAEIWPEIAEACWDEEREESATCWHSQPALLPAAQRSLFSYRNNEAIRPAHPETFGEGLRRVHESIDLIQKMADQSHECVLMVTHGHFIREILNLMLDTRITRRFPHDNCGMTLMSFNEVWTMDFCNRMDQTSEQLTACGPPDSL